MSLLRRALDCRACMGFGPVRAEGAPEDSSTQRVCSMRTVYRGQLHGSFIERGPIPVCREWAYVRQDSP